MSNSIKGLDEQQTAFDCNLYKINKESFLLKNVNELSKISAIETLLQKRNY